MKRYGLRQLLAADYHALYSDRPAPPGRALLFAALRFITNPSLHAVVLLRVTNASPAWIAWFLRSVLISRFSMDWNFRCELGPGLVFPHPIGIIIAGTIGSNVTIGHNVTLGAYGRDRLPEVGDGVKIYAGAILAGAAIGEKATIGANAYVAAPVGERAIIGANSFVNRPVAARAVVKSVSETLEPRG